MSNHNRNSNVENARRFLWDNNAGESRGDAESGGALNNRRTTNLSRGAGFSTRDFNVVDQSVNLMDLRGSNANSNINNKSINNSKANSNQKQFSGLFRTKMALENLNKFTDELYGDADAMNQADAEESIYKRRRRLQLPSSVARVCRKLPGPKVLLTISVSVIAFVLIFTSLHSFEELEESNKNENKSKSKNENANNSNSNNNNNTPSGGSEANKEIDDLFQQRFVDFKKRIVDEKVSPEEAFASLNGKGGSPQQQALDWIVLNDEAYIPHGHSAMLDRYGLAVLYFGSNANSGQGWKHTDNWLSEKGICSWYGIECLPKEQEASAENEYTPFTTTYDENNSVTTINLDGNGVKGTIPNELGTAFGELLAINMENNELTGSLPVALSNSVHLKNLLLGHNKLTGTLPEDYKLLDNLHQFSVSHNELVGSISKEWESNLSKLRYFAASHNLLTGTFPDVRKMTRLTGLFLEVNKMDGRLPDSLEGMTSLLDLRIGHNKFSGPIQALQALTNLETLDLASNEFTGTIPNMFDTLFHFHELVLANNKFKGSIPQSMTHLMWLKTLNLDSNEFEGSLPAGLGLLTDIETLSLRDNQFEGIIPTLLGKLDDIKTLSLNGNKLSGPIPSQLGSCFRLTTLHLHNNKLTGTIPLELGELAGLSNFKMESNGFEGATMPTQVCGLRDDDLSILTSDCKNAKKVACDCCTECH